MTQPSHFNHIPDHATINDQLSCALALVALQAGGESVHPIPLGWYVRLFPSRELRWKLSLIVRAVLHYWHCVYVIRQQQHNT